MFDSNTLSVYIVKLRNNYLREIITDNHKCFNEKS